MTVPFGRSPRFSPQALILALLLDLALGDPPNRYHPVAWMGTAIHVGQRAAPRRGRLAQFIYGALVVFGGAGAVAGLGRLAERLLLHLSAPWSWLVAALLLKTTFTFRGLAVAAEEVRAALLAGDLPAARRLLSWHLVSRATLDLGPSQVAAATIESVAENLSDGIVAPLLAYALGGLPGAFAYRFINTADAMLGYRDPDREWLGKAAARLDDLANLLPARITAGLLLLASALLGENVRSGWHHWRCDAGRTASPNAGQPMSVMAGVLGVELEKVGSYRLGAGLRRPTAEDISRAVRLAAAVTAIGTGGLVGVLSLLARRAKENHVA